MVIGICLRCAQCESPGLGVEHYSTSWRLIVFHIGGDNPVLLKPIPHFGVTPRMDQVMSIRLCFAERGAVNDRLAIDQPENTDVGFFLQVPHSFIRNR